jgi:hypothetical protein
MTEQIKITCEAYRKNSDGSWASTRVSDIQTTDKSIRVNPGITFKKERTMWGIDVVKLLEETCSE